MLLRRKNWAFFIEKWISVSLSPSLSFSFSLSLYFFIGVQDRLRSNWNENILFLLNSWVYQCISVELWVITNQEKISNRLKDPIKNHYASSLDSSGRKLYLVGIEFILVLKRLWILKIISQRGFHTYHYWCFH